MRTLDRNWGLRSSRMTLEPGAACAQVIAAKKPAAPPPATTTGRVLIAATYRIRPNRRALSFQELRLPHAGEKRKWRQTPQRREEPRAAEPQPKAEKPQRHRATERKLKSSFRFGSASSKKCPNSP